ncbi:DUF3021 domain-containing protein [Paenibacillus donghaensis]|uniref:DUF3021 family protein n=1 Tax=Paenibacillus donghaensis TaxID=414771 RepID=UPI001883E54A|nr:DUF3021 family protein [Paenibacillus donghaensis]MBE9914916.1 DUF3021 domain-containing protein [Paenibacillus donghaensis]
MRLSEFLKRLARDYLLVLAGIVICIVLLNQIYILIYGLDASKFSLGFRQIYAFMICALVGVLPSHIFDFFANPSEKGMRIRILIHFIIVEAVIIVFANMMGWVTGVSASVILALEIAIIFGIVQLLVWKSDLKVANEINEQLKKLKEHVQ